MISHDVKAAVENANKILHIGNSTEFFGLTEDYLRSEAGRRFLGQKEGEVDYD